MTVEDAQSIVEDLDPAYAQEIRDAALIDEVEAAVWIGAAKRLQETRIA